MTHKVAPAMFGIHEVAGVRGALPAMNSINRSDANQSVPNDEQAGNNPKVRFAALTWKAT